MTEYEIITKYKFGTNFGIIMLILMCIYPLVLIFVFDLGNSYNLQVPTIATSAPMMIITCLFLWYHVRLSGRGWHVFGITIDKSVRNLALGIVYSIPPIMVVVITKILLIKYHPDYAEEVIFFSAEYLHDATFNLIAIGALYALFIPVQEFIRLIIQNTLKIIFDGRVWPTLLLTAFSFAAVHSHLSLVTVIGCFFIGLYFAYLTHKYNSVVMLSILHLMLGQFAFYIVGF